MAKADKTELTKADSTDLSEIDRLSQQYAGAGQSEREEDRIQAFVKVLHQLSPEMNPAEPTYVEGAKPGDILITAQNILIPGQEGFFFQPCEYIYAWAEWSGPPGTSSRRVNSYPERPVHLGGESTAPGKIVLPNGHEIVETRYHLGLVYIDGLEPFPATISYSSTGTNVSKNWIHKMRAKRNSDGSLTPIFKYLWRLITVPQSNDRGQRWHLLTPKDKAEQPATPEQFKAGAEIYDKLKEHKLKMAEEDAVNAQIDQIPF